MQIYYSFQIYINIHDVNFFIYILKLFGLVVIEYHNKTNNKWQD